MSPKTLTDYLHANIPLSRAMGVSAVSVSENEVALSAPLQPNLNMHGTMFGGSSATLGLLAAWSALHVRLEASGFDAELVIQTSEHHYTAPAQGDAIAVARIEPEGWAEMAQRLQRRGRGRLHVEAEVSSDGVVATRFTGQFVATLKG